MKFLPLGLDDKPRVDAALAADPPRISELTFTNLWVWRGRRAVSLAPDDGALLLLCREGDRRFFLPPVGAADPVGAASRLFAIAAEAGFPLVIERVPATAARALVAAGFAAAPDRDCFDYVYAVREIAALEGRHFDGKRNQLRRATREHACVYEPLGEAAVAECLQLGEQWCDLRSCHLDPLLAAEQEAIRSCLAEHRRLGLTGGIVRVDGRLAAFALAERLNADTAVIHFEKADPAVTGLYQLIFHWFCREALGAFTYVNREQDLGLPGLRAAKEGWRPHHLVEKFTVTAPAGAPPGG